MTLDGDDLDAIAALLLSGGVRLADAVTHGGTTAGLVLQSIRAVNPSGDACRLESTAAGGAALFLVADNALTIYSGDVTAGSAITIINMSSNGSTPAISISSLGAGPVLSAATDAVGFAAVEITSGTGQDVIRLIPGSSGYGFSGTLSPATLASLFTVDSTKVYADAVAGSVVKEIADNTTATISGTIDTNILSINGNTFAGANVPCILADGVAHGGTPGSSTATMALQQLLVKNTAGDAVQMISTSGAGTGLWIQGTYGVIVYEPTTNCGITIAATGVSMGFSGDVGTNAISISTPIHIQTQTGIAISVASDDDDAVKFLSAGAGKSGLSLQGGAGGFGFSGTLSPATLASYFTVDTTKVYADAIAGSVVKEIASNAGGGSDPDVILSGTLGDQSLSSDLLDIVLPSGPADNVVFSGARLRMTGGAARYQERTIQNWNGADKIATVDVPFNAAIPASGDAFEVRYDHSCQLDPSGNTIAVASVNNFYAAALAQLFTLDSTKVYADAVAGSVVKEIADNAGGGEGGGSGPTNLMG